MCIMNDLRRYSGLIHNQKEELVKDIRAEAALAAATR